MKLISIVFSFKNEEKNLEELVIRTAKTFKELNSYNYELIFVNDNSDDNSENKLIKLQNDYPITIINMSRTFGVAPCVLAGFKHAKGDAVIYMDSDLQDPPELIDQMYHKAKEGYDCVYALRTKKVGENFLRLLIINCLSIFTL